MSSLLSEVLEIEVKVDHDGGSGFAFSRDVLDDGGTMRRISCDRKNVTNNEPDNTFPRARYHIRSPSEVGRPQDDNGNARFP